MDLKIVNKEEVGASILSMVFDQWTLHQGRLDLKGEKVKIREILVIKDRTVHPSRTISGTGNSLVSTILFGLPGAIVSAAANTSKFDVAFDVHLTDGRVVELDIKDEQTIKILMRYVKVADKDRRKSRAARGIV